MKIGVDARSLLGGSPRGEGKSLLRLYTELGATHPDWRFVLYGEKTDNDPLMKLDRCDVVRFDVPGFRFNLWENFALPVRAAMDRLDVFHGASSSAPRWLSVPSVITVHDVIPLVFDDGLEQAYVDRFRTQLSHALRRARTVIAVSEHTKRDLVRELSVDAGRVTVIPWGVDVPAARGSQAATAAGARPYFLVFGGQARRKNTLGTVSLFADTARSHPDVLLEVVGLTPGPMRNDAVQLAVRLGVGDRVRVRSYVSDNELEGLYRGATALLYLSKYEGFGLPLLDAMAHGVPVIASNRTSIPEVVGDAALVVDPDEPRLAVAAMLDVLHSDALRDSLRRRGYARCARFTWRDAATRTAAVLGAAANR